MSGDTPATTAIGIVSAVIGFVLGVGTTSLVLPFHVDVVAPGTEQLPIGQLLVRPIDSGSNPPIQIWHPAADSIICKNLRVYAPIRDAEKITNPCFRHPGEQSPSLKQMQPP